MDPPDCEVAAMRRGSYDDCAASLRPHLRHLAQRRRSAPSLAFGKALGMPWSPIKEEAPCWVSVEQSPFVLGLTSENGELLLDEGVQVTEGSKIKERHLFLFSNVLVFSKSKSTTGYRLKRRVSLQDVWLYGFEDEAVGEEGATGDIDLRVTLVLAWDLTVSLVCFWTHSTYGNIMFDPRVVRGNTYAQRILPIAAQSDPDEVQRQQEIRRRNIARKRSREQSRTRTPEAAQGRKHIDVQTECYLEELSDITVAKDIACQTDSFLDRPASPLFIPAKSGKDVGTQIEEGELFDFDTEVQPVLEVLVGKVIEQSLLEVMEEEELAYLRTQQRVFEERRNNELAEVMRLQEQDRRRTEEKERRMAQQKEALKKEKEVAEKIAVRAYTQEYLSGLLPTVFTSLRSHGYFFDPVQNDIETNFMPWLMDEVNNSLERRNTARTLLDNIIYDVVQKRQEMFKETQ